MPSGTKSVVGTGSRCTERGSNTTKCYTPQPGRLLPSSVRAAERVADADIQTHTVVGDVGPARAETDGRSAEVARARRGESTSPRQAIAWLPQVRLSPRNGGFGSGPGDVLDFLNPGNLRQVFWKQRARRPHAAQFAVYSSLAQVITTDRELPRQCATASSPKLEIMVDERHPQVSTSGAELEKVAFLSF